MGLNEFIELLNSDKVTGLLFDKYSEEEYSINTVWQNADLFISYLKAYILGRYIASNKKIKNKIADDLKNGILNHEFLLTFIDKINCSSAKEAVNLEGVVEEDFTDLHDHLEDEMYAELSEEDEYIKGLIIERNDILEEDYIENGQYVLASGYKISKEEMDTIKCARYVPAIIHKIHCLYDEDNLNRPICNYDAIDDELLKKFAFHTECNNPQLYILFNDGTIVDYYNGDIRICPLKIDEIVKYTKLQFIENHYNPDNEENVVLQLALEQYDELDPTKEIDDLDDKEFELLINFASDYIFGLSTSLAMVYSRKMINDSKKEVEGIKSLVKKYKL